MSDKKYLVSRDEVREMVKDAYRRGAECRPMIDQKWFEDHECKDRTCEWHQDSDGNWHTSCGEIFTLCNCESLKCNNIIFCFYCGAKVVEL